MPLGRDSHTALSHDAAFELLPWYVNKSLPEAEAATLRAHVAGCEACQQEINTLNELEHAILTSEETLAEPSAQLLSQIMERIEDYESELATAAPAFAPSWRTRFLEFWSVAPVFARSALVAQFVVLLLLVGALIVFVRSNERIETVASQERARADRNEQLLAEAQRRYTVLVGPEDEGKDLLRFKVVFQEQVTEKEIRALLTAINCTIVGGPSAQRFYIIALPVSPGADKQRVAAEILQQLRSKPQVVFFVEQLPD